MKRTICFFICFALCVLFVGCKTDLPDGSNLSSAEVSLSATEPVSPVSSCSPQAEIPAKPETTSPPSGSPADETSVSWDSVFVRYTAGTNPKGAGWYVWENSLEDAETITTLWNLAEKAQSIGPRDYQYAPDGGVPFEVDFISETKTIHCAFFHRSALVDGVWYDFLDDDYRQVLRLAGWK